MSPSDQLQRRAFRAWRPPPRRSLSQWADEFFHLSAESSAEAGKWHTLGYQRGILDAVTDPAVEYLSFMKSARVGYTKILNIACGYYAHQDPCAVMVVEPTIEDAEGHSKEEIAPMIRDTPVLRDLFQEPKSKDGGNTILQKLYPGGSLSLVGANSPRGFRRVSRRVVLFDEVDGYPPSAGPEGDQIKLGIKRTDYFWNRKILRGSTPTLKGASRIEAAFEDGDQRRFYIACPHCEHKDYLTFRESNADDEANAPRGHYMKWPKGKPAAAYFVCRECGCEIEHKDKVRLIEEAAAAQEGELSEFGKVYGAALGLGWVAAKPFAGHASFHLWAAYSYSPNATWGHIAREFVDANRGGPEELKTFVNTALGETWSEKGDAPDYQRLYERREQYPAAVPEGGLFLVAGADVQRNPKGIFCEVVAYGRGKESWSIETNFFEGDAADLGPNGPWPKLAAILDRDYEHETGVQMRVSMLAVDSGDQTQSVYNWCRQYPLNRVIAIKGTAGRSILVGLPSAVDVLVNGRKLARGYRVWPVSGEVAKSEFYGQLKLARPTVESADSYPPGYCHFPEYGEEYFKQITGEQVVMVTNKRTGFQRAEWQLVPGRANHFLDCRVYARAAASVFGLDRFRAKDFDLLAAKLGRTRAAKPKLAEMPAATQDGRPAPAPAKTTWIKPRGPRTRAGNWIRRK
jgi:terminase, large subunit